MKSAKRKVPYLEIAEELRERIRKENLAFGTPLMSCRELARYYKVSLSTAHKALLHLTEEGVLYRRHGSGTYVGREEVPRERPMVIGCNFRRRPNERSSILDSLIPPARKNGFATFPISFQSKHFPVPPFPLSKRI